MLSYIGKETGIGPLALVEGEHTTAGDTSLDLLAETLGSGRGAIENQYGRGDHDHVTRGLGSAVATGSKAPVVIAEDHRDEFISVAHHSMRLRHRLRRASPSGRSRSGRFGGLVTRTGLRSSLSRPNRGALQVEPHCRGGVGAFPDTSSTMAPGQEEWTWRTAPTARSWGGVGGGLVCRASRPRSW